MTTRIYAALDYALLVVEERDGNWDVNQYFDGDERPYAVAVDPFAPERAYLGTFNDGLWRTVDGGDSWSQIGSDFSSSRVMAVAVAAEDRPEEYGTVYAGTEPSAVYRSDDGGDTWSECPGLTDLDSATEWSFPGRPDTHHVRWIEPDPNDPERLYVSIEAGAVVRTSDRGETWVDRVPDGPFDAHTLATHPDAPNRVYAAAGDGMLEEGHEYRESTDGGESWKYSSEGIEHHYGWAVAVDPGDPDTRVIATSPGAGRAHDIEDEAIRTHDEPNDPYSVAYRRQGEKPWQQCTDGFPDPSGLFVPVLATISDEPGTFYALTNRGLYRSTDSGETWDGIEISWNDNYREQQPRSVAATSIQNE
ncbi:hypothetical protein [Haladaptatus sp. T7]|uniref:VPS10 domain-containing protein n=1 Tax=Haladaptatus sp. T7 TaxID=2029368 RepID=UPI0021A25681|nr:hypothetical protein [Haladaptatus sp. T7]GKZ16022.1 glycosyl hydrolase [Haladaptatus sp. T7]